jgi:hypothetical protein
VRYERIAIVGAVADNPDSFLERNEGLGLGDVVHLASRQHVANESPRLGDERMELGRETTPRPTERLTPLSPVVL